MHLEDIMTLKKTLANAIFSRPLPLLDKINWNARAQHWRAKNDGILSAVDRFGLYDLVGRDIGNQSIDYLEFGVFPDWCSHPANI